MTQLLTLQHRKAQVRLSTAAVRDIVRIWPGFDPTNIDASWRALESAIMEIIGRHRVKSSLVAQAYYETLRELNGITARLPVVPLGSAATWQPAALTSINVTGPILTKSAIAAKQPLASLASNALVRVSGAAQRHVLNGGRTMMDHLMRQDKVRYRRVTSSNPRKFCTMLRDRGAVYVRETSMFQSHDHCSCTAEPVFKN